MPFYIPLRLIKVDLPFFLSFFIGFPTKFSEPFNLKNHLLVEIAALYLHQDFQEIFFHFYFYWQQSQLIVNKN